MAGLYRLRSRNYHRSLLSKPVGEDFFELRHIGELNTRVLYFFMKGQRISLVHVNKKKTRVLFEDQLRDSACATRFKEAGEA